MALRPFSDHDRGLFISIDGPSGAGKSIETEIHPHIERGTTVISDRCILSGLVIQRFDGIDPASMAAQRRSRPT
jgi:thymidylate kinase